MSNKLSRFDTNLTKYVQRETDSLLGDWVRYTREVMPLDVSPTKDDIVMINETNVDNKIEQDHVSLTMSVSTNVDYVELRDNVNNLNPNKTKFIDKSTKHIMNDIENVTWENIIKIKE